MGLRCHKLLWHRFHAAERFPLQPPVASAAHDEDAQLARLARRLFPHGREPGALSQRWEDLATSTATALADRLPLFAAGFAASGHHAVVDVLTPVPQGEWDIVGFKKNALDRQHHLLELAFQAWLAALAGLKIRRVFRLHVNRGFVRSGPLDPRRFFTYEDVTSAVAAASREMASQVENLQDVLKMRDSPEPGLGVYCLEPRECPLKSLCWQGLPEHNVFQLHRVRLEQAFALSRAGLQALERVPPSFVKTKARRIQLLSLATRNPCVDKPAIRAFLDCLRYPLCFLDFETFAAAIPPFDDLRPYQQVPFQFSLHVLNGAGETPAHHAYLADGRSDPSIEILGQLQERLGNAGSIVAYNARFEIAVIDELCARFPQFLNWWSAAKLRVIDLLAPFRSFAFHHFSQKGTASLKAVLPALTGRGYNDLAIRDGNQASQEFLRVTFGDVTDAERTRVRAQLSQYCCRDTEGMVWIVENLARLCAPE